MVYNGKPYFLMDDLGGEIPPFKDTPKFQSNFPPANPRYLSPLSLLSASMVFDCVESGANEFVWETDRGVACQR